jgi:hypothetical protein
MNNKKKSEGTIKTPRRLKAEGVYHHYTGLARNTEFKLE